VNSWISRISLAYDAGSRLLTEAVLPVRMGTDMPSLAIVPAAGRSERFGGQKLLADVNSEPLLNHTLWSLLEAGLDRVVVVTAPGVSLPTVDLLEDPRVTCVINPDPARGMFSSIQVGLAVSTGEAILVLPADMPFVAPHTVALMISACAAQDAAAVPLYRGRRGHPIAIPGRFRDALAAADAGTLKDALLALGVRLLEVPVDDEGVVRDVDVPADLKS